jgi:hypothetical protein
LPGSWLNISVKKRNIDSKRDLPGSWLDISVKNSNRDLPRSWLNISMKNRNIDSKRDLPGSRLNISGNRTDSNNLLFIIELCSEVCGMIGERIPKSVY